MEIVKVKGVIRIEEYLADGYSAYRYFKGIDLDNDGLIQISTTNNIIEAKMFQYDHPIERKKIDLLIAFVQSCYPKKKFFVAIFIFKF